MAVGQVGRKGSPKYTVYVKAVGFNAIAKKLHSLAPAATAELQDELKKVAEKIRKTSMSLTPVDTGALRDSTRVLTKWTGTAAPKTRGTVGVAVAVGGIVSKGKFVNYAAVVHETHPTMSHFLKKAVELHANEVRNKIGARIDKLIRRYGRG